MVPIRIQKGLILHHTKCHSCVCQGAGRPNILAGRRGPGTSPHHAAATPLARAAGRPRASVVVGAVRLGLLDGGLRGRQARDGHAQRGAGHIVDDVGHKLNRLGVAAVLACGGRQGAEGGRAGRQG